jgi:adenosylhomocysteine nucleosidase
MLKSEFTGYSPVLRPVINSKNVVLVKCGVGKVNAARTTQVLIDNFDLDYVINVGTAGGLNENIEIGDVVIAEKLVQHDFDITAGGYEKGYISNLGKYFNCDENLVKKGKEIIDSMKEDFKAITGLIATGDIFVQDISVKDRIKEEFDADIEVGNYIGESIHHYPEKDIKLMFYKL